MTTTMAGMIVLAVLFCVSVLVAIFAGPIQRVNQRLLERSPGAVRAFCAAVSFGHPRRDDPFWVFFQRRAALAVAVVDGLAMAFVMMRK